MPAISVVVPTLGAPSLERALRSLGEQTVDAEILVVDDGSRPADIAERVEALNRDQVLDRAGNAARTSVIRLERNSGFSRACNVAAARAAGKVLVLLNDDCVVEHDFLERICAPLDPAAGVAMAASVMRDWAHPELIDSAGMELDRTLLVWDYLNGEPISILDHGVPDPVGPSAAAAAFDLAAFRDLGGFDERLFAYWEDVDLVLRLRREGYVCRLAADARGTHEHSATYGSGSPRKNFLTGFGRGYVLRKWGVMRTRNAPAVLARDLVVCAGQGMIDRNLAGVRGRVAGWRAADAEYRYPAALPVGDAPGALATLRRRFARRSRLRARSARPAARAALAESVPGGADLGAGARRLRSIAFFHLAETSGPSRSLERELEWLAGRGRLTVVAPGPGEVAELFGGFAEIRLAGYEALTRGAGPLRTAGTLLVDVQRFRELIRASDADLVVVVSAMLPAALIAARLERIPAVVYCGEIFEQPGMGTAQLGARRALRGLTARLAAGIVAGSGTVARQFDGGRCANVEVVYPPVGEQYAKGDGAAFRATHRIPSDSPLIAAAGSLTAGRGQDLLVHALVALRQSRPTLRLVLAGAPFERPQDRAYAEGLRRLVSERGLDDAVSFAGRIENVADLLAAADVVVNPARFAEPFGRVAFEAALAGTPAVVTRVGAASELFEDRVSALVVAPDDPDAIAGAVAALLDDPELGERLSGAAADFARARLSPRASVAGFRRVVERALSEAARAPA